MKKILLILCLLLYIPAISSGQVVTNTDDNWSIDIPDGWEIDKNGNIANDVFIYTINKNLQTIAILYTSRSDKSIDKKYTFETLPEKKRNDMLNEMKQGMDTAPNVKVIKAGVMQIGSNYTLHVKMTYKDKNGKTSSLLVTQFLNQSELYSFMLVNANSEKIYEQQYMDLLGSLEFHD